jgi:uncharacterized HAD superfamily protein
MRIGFDMDGVVADLHTTFIDAALELFPDLDRAAVAKPEVAASPVPGADPTSEASADAPAEPAVSGLGGLSLTRRQTDQVWRHVEQTQDFWEELSETEDGVVSRIAEVADQHRWEVIFLTSRPRSAGHTVQRQSQRWLEKRGFSLPSVYVVQGSRGKIADALQLDVVVDDRPDNCLDVMLESKARAILIWRGSKASVPVSAKRLGIGVSSTLGECLDVLVEAERAASTPADLVTRLKRLLGLAKGASQPKS